MCWPSVCGVDSKGNVLVADTSNRRIQLYSGATRQWSLVELGPQKLKSLSFACLMNDVLYVNEFDERMLYAYKLKEDVETEKRYAKASKGQGSKSMNK